MKQGCHRISNWLRTQFRKGPLQRLRHRFEHVALRGMAWAIPRLSRARVLRLADRIGSIALRLDRDGRQRGLQNLEAAVRHGGLDLRGRHPDEVMRDCYQNFARGILDLFWFSRLTPETMGDWVEIEDEARLRGLLETDQGAIFLTPHYGIFEWCSLVMGFRGLRLNIVAQDFANPSLTDLFRRAREHSGHRILSRQGAMLKLLREVKRGGFVAMLPDLNIRPQGVASEVNMFGLPTYLTSVHTEIAQRCQTPMFVAVCEPLADGRAKLRVLDVIRVRPDADRETVVQTTQAVWDHFEEAIRQRPELWLWMYRHWKYGPSETPSDRATDRATPAGVTRPAAEPLRAAG
ncbi:MAG: hypothetical protein EA381_05005 [Planctomycetaceae bacterium]|nr:MAG: hypothetical protein EA381_05005 [Planctomycetaceae bacterium]